VYKLTNEQTKQRWKRNIGWSIGAGRQSWMQCFRGRVRVEAGERGVNSHLIFGCRNISRKSSYCRKNFVQACKIWGQKTIGAILWKFEGKIKIL